MSVRDTIELQDLFSPVINSVVSSVNSAVSAMEQMQKAMNVPMDSGALQAARAQVDSLNDVMRQATDISRNTKAALGTLGNESSELAQKMSGAGSYAKQFEGNIRSSGEVSNSTKSALDSLGNGTDNVAKKMAGADANIRKVGEGIKSVGEESQRASVSFNEAASGVGNLFIALGGYKILNTVKDALSEVTTASTEFESAATGIFKTIEGTQAQLEALSDAAKNMSLDIPSTSVEIAGVMESAGQLGIATQNVEDFSKTMIDLSNSTNLTSDIAASSLAKFANVTSMDPSKYQNLGSAIVDLGNNFATTEADIVSMATRLASAASLAGMSQADIMGLATAMSSVGIEAEAGGSSMSTLITKLQLAVETGAGLEDFASVADMSMNKFADTFRNNGVEALRAFIVGLNDTERNGASAAEILNDMNLKEIRLSNTIRALAGSGNLMTNAVNTASQAWEQNTALANEANKRYATLESKIKITENAANKLKVAVGDSLNPVMNGLNDAAAGALTKLSELAEESPVVTAGLAGTAGAVGVTVGALTTVAPAASSVITAVSALKKSFDLSNASMLAFGGKAALVVAGIGTVVGVGTALYTAYSNLKGVIDDYNGTLEQCSNEIKNTEKTYKIVCDIYGESSQAAKNLSNELDVLNAQYKKGGGYITDYEQRLEESQKSINSFADEYDRKMNDINDSWQNGLIASAQLETLSQKAQITNTDLDMMSKYADYLNDTFNCNIEVNYDTGKLTGFNPTSINSIMSKMASENRKQVAMESVTGADFTSQYIDALEELQNIENDYEKVKKEIEKTMNDPSGVNMTGYTMKEANVEFSKQITEAKRQIEENNNIIREAYNDIGVPEQAEEYIEFLNSMADGFNNLENSVNQLNSESSISTFELETDGINAAKHEAEDYTDKILLLCQAYDDVHDAVEKNIQKQFELFDTASLKSEEYMNSTVANAQAALDSQKDYWQNYHDNIAYLRSVTAEDLGVTQQQLEQFMSFIRSGTPEAVGLSEDLKTQIEGNNTEAVRNVIETNAKVEELKNNTVDDISEWAVDLNKNMKTIYDDMEKAVKDLDLHDKSKTSAENTVNAYIDAIANAEATAVETANSLVKSVQAVFDSAELSYTIKTKAAADKATASAKVNDKKAGGGIAKGGLTLVGENGPELIMLNGGERVYNNSDTEKMLSVISGMNPVNYMSSNSYYSAENQSDYSTVSENIINNYNSLQSMYDDSRIITILENMQNILKNSVGNNNAVNALPEYSVDMSLLEELFARYKNDDKIRNYNESVIYGNTYTSDNSRSYSAEYVDNISNFNDSVIKYGDVIRNAAEIFNDVDNSSINSLKYGDTVKNINDFITSYSDEIKNISSTSSFDNSYRYAAEYSGNSSVLNDFISNYSDIIDHSVSNTGNYDNSRSYSTEYTDTVKNINDFITSYSDVISYHSFNTEKIDNMRSYTTDYGDNISEYRNAAIDYTMPGSIGDRNVSLDTLSARQIDININGSGKIGIQSGLDKDEVVSILLDNMKPVLMSIVEQEMFEEGESYYDY